MGFFEVIRKIGNIVIILESFEVQEEVFLNWIESVGKNKDNINESISKSIETAKDVGTNNRNKVKT